MERHLLFVRSCVQTCAAAAATAGQPPGCGAPQQQRVEGALSPAAGADAALPLPASTRSQGSRVAPGLQDCPRKLVSRPAQGWRAGRGRCPTRRELGTAQLQPWLKQRSVPFPLLCTTGRVVLLQAALTTGS